MYTQEVICPHCGKMTMVNVGDAKGSVSTPCQECKKSTIVETDENGKVYRIAKAGGKGLGLLLGAALAVAFIAIVSDDKK